MNSISVIIPVFNEAKTIGSCLKSLWQQTLKPAQIIIVDDGSTDETTSIIKSLTNDYPVVKLFSQSHQGPAIARNLGAKKATSDILVFVDADMEFTANFLEDLTKPIRSNKAKGSWSGQESVRNWHNLWARCWNYNQNRRNSNMVSASKSQKKVFRAILKSEFDKVQGFDPIGYTDDWTLVAKLGYQPIITRAKFFHHNPASLVAVFSQARWIGKRRYKAGKLGILLAIFRTNAG